MTGDSKSQLRARSFCPQGELYTTTRRRGFMTRVPYRTIKTPQILELSGIGDRSILGPLGIPVILDLPGVGANAQDHILCSAPLFRTHNMFTCVKCLLTVPVGMKEDTGVFTAGMLRDPNFAKKIRQE